MKPTTLAVAITEPVYGSDLTDLEKRYFTDELTQLLGLEETEKLLQAAKEFHERIHNHPAFQKVQVLYTKDKVEEIQLKNWISEHTF